MFKKYGVIEVYSLLQADEPSGRAEVLSGLDKWLNEHFYKSDEMDFYKVTINRDDSSFSSKEDIRCDVRLNFKKHFWSYVGVGSEISNAVNNCLSRLSPKFIECL